MIITPTELKVRELTKTGKTIKELAEQSGLSRNRLVPILRILEASQMVRKELQSNRTYKYNFQAVCLKCGTPIQEDEDSLCGKE